MVCLQKAKVKFVVGAFGIGLIWQRSVSAFRGQWRIEIPAIWAWSMDFKIAGIL
jgi:hypothetical protein